LNLRRFDGVRAASRNPERSRWTLNQSEGTGLLASDWSLGLKIKWSGREDLNLRPPACEKRARINVPKQSEGTGLPASDWRSGLKIKWSGREDLNLRRFDGVRAASRNPERSRRTLKLITGIDGLNLRAPAREKRARINVPNQSEGAGLLASDWRSGLKKNWSGREDLNLRPPARQKRARINVPNQSEGTGLLASDWSLGLKIKWSGREDLNVRRPAREKRARINVPNQSEGTGLLASDWSLGLKIKWSGREDLNLRPPGPEPGALPG
jgi:hypothetical protein